MIVVNFFAGPGAGKSTLATGLFYNFKIRGINCEYVHEEAKDMTWEERYKTLECQPYVFGKQMRNIWRLKDKVDIIITDSPLLLSLIYLQEGQWPSSFNKFVIDQFNMFNNINFFIKRTKKYSKTGRNQSEQEAVIIDEKINDLLTKEKIRFESIFVNINMDIFSADILKNLI